MYITVQSDTCFNMCFLVISLCLLFAAWKFSEPSYGATLPSLRVPEKSTMFLAAVFQWLSAGSWPENLYLAHVSNWRIFLFFFIFPFLSASIYWEQKQCFPPPLNRCSLKLPDINKWLDQPLSPPFFQLQVWSVESETWVILAVIWFKSWKRAREKTNPSVSFCKSN